MKKLLSLTALLLIGWGLKAQTSIPNKVFTGENGAKTTVCYAAAPGFVQFLSGDARYISGVYGGAAGFVYDIQKDTMLAYEVTLPGFASPDHYAGQDDPGETVVNAFVYYNGEKHPLEKVLSSGKPSYDDVFISGVQNNCENIVTMVYEEYTKPSGSKGFVNIGAIHDGKTGKLRCKLPLVWELPASGEALGFGARGDCISGDGTVVGGHSTNPFASAKWSLAFWDISDPNHIKAYGIEDDGFDFGSLNGVNHDGSVLVGGSQTNGLGVIVNYDKAAGDFSYKTVKPLPSWDFVDFTGVADNGLIVGYCGMGLDPGTREPVIYTELTGLVKMDEFLYEYYNIDLQGLKLYTPMAISPDGNIHTGFFYDENTGDGTPYYNQLGTARIQPRARKITARVSRDNAEVLITWQQPFKSENILKGYNIYRDDETTPLNTTLLTEPTYTDKASVGRHTYYIEVIYDNAEPAKKAASNTVQVVAAGECYPVQRVGHRLEYNRYATVFWGQPSSEVAALAKNDRAVPGKEAVGRFNLQLDGSQTAQTDVERASTPQPKAYTSTTLDYIANVDMLTYSGFAATKIGNRYYTSSHLGGGIQVIDQFNEIIEVLTPKGLGAVMSMYYDENENALYCGTKTTISKIDLDDPTELIDQFAVPARFLAYVPTLDGGKGGFVAGTEHSCNTYTKTGKLIEANILDFKSPIYACGAAYLDGRLYVSSASGKYYNEIYVYDFEKRTLIGKPIQVVEDPALYSLLSFDGQLTTLTNTTQAGSLSICELEDGTKALGAVFQCAYMTSRFMLLEAKSDDAVKGYDLYRSFNGGEPQKLNTDGPLATRRYSETLSEPGQYAYYVKVLPQAEGAPVSASSPIDTIVIATPSACPKPTLSVKESNRWAVLEWLPQASDNILIGFNLYRDDEELGRFWNEDMRLEYVDQATELDTYTYKVEAVYGDGCVAAETAEITLTGKGSALAPFGLTLETGDKTPGAEAYDVKATWETPMFEEPLALRYCNAVQLNAVTFDNYYECWAAAGWDTANLGLYKDLYLVGMEFMIGATPKTFESFVILNDKMVYTQNIQRPIAKEWQTVMFDKSFTMDQPHEVVVGYHTTFTAENAGVLAVDESVSKSGYSDIISLDGKQWSTLKAGGKKGSWCIAALVVHKRDLDAAKKSDGSIDYKQLEGNIIRMAQTNRPLNAEVITLPTTFTAKPSAKEGLTLTGFNLYRKAVEAEEGSEVKLNDELLTTFELIDPSVPIAEYDYIIGAVYADGQEIKTSTYINLDEVANEDLTSTLSLDLYPNPATDVLNIGGEYETLRIFDMAGRLLQSYKATSQIQLGGLQPGTYFFHFTGADARKAVYKVVVR